MSIIHPLTARLRHPRHPRFAAFMDALREEAAGLRQETAPGPRRHAIITAGERRTADALCEIYAAELWTPAERAAFRALRADGGVS